MKKVILSLAIFAATSLSMIAADNNTANNAPACKAGTECTKPCKGMKAFEGLNLTDAQKTKLQELAKEQQTKKADCCKKDKKDNKDAQKEKLPPEQKQQKKAEMQ
ncbi:MAG: hypothetical protein K2M10_00105, partial [Muribaculaceae bacterium]|nr:hypothetical protein [Muribaculaceae bacterium]